jgi:hypothetical protein
VRVLRWNQNGGNVSFIHFQAQCGEFRVVVLHFLVVVLVVVVAFHFSRRLDFG